MNLPRPNRRLATSLIVASAAVLAIAGIASARMSSTKLGPALCETTGGGKFVSIPDFPGERIDRRLLKDVRFLEKRYKIFITDGYSMDDVHSLNGEHPVGLALDIVPNKAAGGTWSDIDTLARWAEPKQNQPRPPFRWVGYDGDANHGRGNHLHLSWSHSETKPGRPAKLVNTIRCPDAIGGQTTPPIEPDPPDDPVEPTEPITPPSGGSPSTGAHRDHGHDRNHERDRNRDRNRDRDRNGPSTGGVAGTATTGGVGGKLGLAPIVIEADGVGLGD